MASTLCVGMFTVSFLPFFLPSFHSNFPFSFFLSFFLSFVFFFLIHSFSCFFMDTITIPAESRAICYFEVGQTNSVMRLAYSSIATSGRCRVKVCLVLDGCNCHHLTLRVQIKGLCDFIIHTPSLMHVTMINGPVQIKLQHNLSHSVNNSLIVTV